MHHTISSRRMALPVPLVALFVALGLSACGGDSDDPPPSAPDTATTAQGSVRAVDRTGLGMRSYFGIPFAAPPVGALRWRAPQAPASWSTPLTKTASASPCLQTGASTFRLSGDSEDCLYLDVHAPTGPGPFPVMVWIHGGAFNTGGTVTYADPSPLVAKGVIVVTVAYRMGAMGFLGHPALRDANGATGNYGIMDQQAALRWVRNNIASFAGDQNNVTVFGESAGGMSVLTHLASPGSAGLFDKAIVQSGAYGINGQLSLAQLETNSTTVVNNALAAAGASCATVDAACLRNLPEAVVRNQLAAAFNASMSSPTPSVDGSVLPQSIRAAFAAGTNHKLPVINGINEDEFSLFIASGELGRRAAAVPPNLDPTNAAQALPAVAYGPTIGGLAAGTGVTASDLATLHYPLANYGSNAALQPSLGATAVGTDVLFACNALSVSKRIRTQTSPVWMYEFRDQTSEPSLGIVGGNYALSFPQGAAHSNEIQYLFKLHALGTAEQSALQATMSQYWANFARTGNPASGGLVPAWGGFSAGAVQSLDVTSGGGVTSATATSFSTQHKCDTVWTALTF